MHDNELLAEALAFFDGEVDDTGNEGVISSLGSDELDPYILLEALEGENFAPIDGQPTSATIAIAPQESVAQGKTKRRRRKQLKPNKAREERRYQVAQLRKDVEDLELTLKQWQEIRSKPTPPASLDKTNGSDANHTVMSTVPADEMQVIVKIKKLLFKRTIKRDSTQSDATKHIRRTNLPPGYIKRIAAALFDELSAGIEVCYLLEESTLEPQSSIPATMPLLRGGVKGEARTLFDRRTLPFNIHATGEAWWRDWHCYRGHKGENPGSVVVESFGLEMNDFKTNSSVTSYGQQILRRDVEGERVVFVWNAYLEPFILENEQVGGIYFLEQCHMIIKPEEESKEDKLASCMSSCYVITPYFLDSTLRSDPRAAALIDFLVGALFANMKAHNDMVEDLLLDQVLQHK
ncbi:hypothetical protein GN244_ATG09015 [Phytophthora infestans]|uniref:M96 mating-specific protein family n=1 Tax=Phytophthora infestans TaxID=4787 RepID=A0A833SW77_PHYIN|nr:hypothetical protein GN244_ATG09015 [Phytophthora infestans]